MKYLACPLEAVLPAEVIAAAETVLSATGFDVFSAPAFWENWIAVQCAGVTTEHKARHDLEIDLAAGLTTAEIKFSRAFHSSFAPIRGRDVSRNVFKWSLTPPQAAALSSDVLILIGLDVDRLLYCWTLPPTFLAGRGRTITITAGSSRVGSKETSLDYWQVPPTEILTAVGIVKRRDRLFPWINTHDAPRRALSRKKRLER